MEIDPKRSSPSSCSTPSSHGQSAPMARTSPAKYTSEARVLQPLGSKILPPSLSEQFTQFSLLGLLPWLAAPARGYQRTHSHAPVQTDIPVQSYHGRPYPPPAALMSAPPTNPSCVVLLVFDCCAFLYRPNDHCATKWTVVQLTPLQEVFGGSAIYCKGKFYYLESFFLSSTLHVIDPFLHKAASQLVMRGPCEDDNIVLLQELGGELFSVQIQTYGSHVIEGFQVFKADLSTKEWVWVETLGDHALFHDSSCSVLLLAADVGCKRNSIYSYNEIGHDVFAWGVYDLGTMDRAEEEMVMHGDFGPWFLPTLDFANPAKAGD